MPLLQIWKKAPETQYGAGGGVESLGAQVRYRIKPVLGSIQGFNLAILLQNAPHSQEPGNPAVYILPRKQK